MRSVTALGLLAAAAVSALAADRMPLRYLLPDWHTGRVETEVRERTLFIRARLATPLAPMRKARVRLETSAGLKLISTQFSGDPARAAITTTEFAGDLPAGGKLFVNAIAERVDDADHAFATLAFEYDFPVDEVLGYIQAHAGDRYPNSRLRSLLEQSVREHHAGRRSGGFTERVEFRGPNAR